MQQDGAGVAYLAQSTMPLQAKPMGGVPKGGPPPPNKKYANVKARLDTGCNELKIKLSETKANARFHRGENFKRLKVGRSCTTLVDLQHVSRYC